MGSVDGYTLLDCMLPCTPPPYPSREYNRRRTSLGESGLLGMTFFRELAAAAVAVVAGWCTGAEPVLPSPRWPCLDDPSPWCPRGRLPRLVASPTPRGALGWAGAPTSGGGGSWWYRWWRRRWKGWEEEEETLLDPPSDCDSRRTLPGQEFIDNGLPSRWARRAGVALGLATLLL